MKKSIFAVALAMLCSSLIFTGCTSIPEPSEKNTTMVYALVDYYGGYDYAGTSETEITNKKSDITLILKNIRTNRNYTLTSNHKGEFIRTNIPCGYYAIKEVSANYEYSERSWSVKFSPDRNNPAYRFEVSNGVTNLGHIKINANYSTENASVQWGTEFENVKMEFEDLHPESNWNSAEWTTISGDSQY